VEKERPPARRLERQQAERAVAEEAGKKIGQRGSPTDQARLE
jgi:hypothetical protein